MSDRIYAQHPDPEKEGVSIDKLKYETIREAILTTLGNGPVPFKDLPIQVKKLCPDFDGSISWYVTTVKLDLEARGVIERVLGKSPQQVRMTKD